MSPPETNPLLHYYYHSYDPLGRGYHFHTSLQINQSNCVKGALGNRYNPRLFLDETSYEKDIKIYGEVVLDSIEKECGPTISPVASQESSESSTTSVGEIIVPDSNSRT